MLTQVSKGYLANLLRQDKGERAKAGRGGKRWFRAPGICCQGLVWPIQIHLSALGARSAILAATNGEDRRYMAKTIKEIARDTGYSRTTVTLVINGKSDDYRISPKARSII